MRDQFRFTILCLLVVVGTGCQKSSTEDSSDVTEGQTNSPDSSAQETRIVIDDFTIPIQLDHQDKVVTLPEGSVEDGTPSIAFVFFTPDEEVAYPVRDDIGLRLELADTGEPLPSGTLKDDVQIKFAGDWSELNPTSTRVEVYVASVLGSPVASPDLAVSGQEIELSIDASSAETPEGFELFLTDDEATCQSSCSSGSSVSVDSINLNSGSRLGGSDLEVTGSGFVSGAEVRVNSVACLQTTFVSVTSLKCLTPPGSTGTVGVSVHNPDSQSASLDNSFTYLNEGWTIMSTVSAPVARQNHSIVWTGSEMIVWGGENNSSNKLDTGGRYDPSGDSWTATTTTSAPVARQNHVAEWSGTEMLVWGGINGGGTPISSGGRYNPATDSWASMNTGGAPSARSDMTSCWNGSKMFVFGGVNGAAEYNDGGLYDPIADSWTASTVTGAPSGRWFHKMVCNETHAFVYGGQDVGIARYTDGAVYTFATDSWTTMSSTNDPTVYRDHAMVLAGDEVIVWGGQISGGSAISQLGWRYNIAGNSWTSMSVVSAPPATRDALHVWAGTRMMIWSGTFQIQVGGLYDPDTDSWSTVTTTGAPGGRYLWVPAKMRWTGSAAIFWGGTDGAFVNTGGVYVP